MQATVNAKLITDSDPVLIPVGRISWPRGADGTILIVVTDDDGAAVNLAGCAVSLGVRDQAGSLVFVKAAALTDALDGECVVTLAAADTDGLTAGQYRFDAWLDAVDGRHQISRPGPFVVLESVTRMGDDPGSTVPIGTGVIGAVDTMTELAAVDASRLTDFFAIGVRGTDGGPRGYYHIEVGRAYDEDGVNAIAALNLPDGQWVRGLE